MLMKNAERIFKAHTTLLTKRQIKFRCRGRGAYIYVKYEPDFELATVQRFGSLDALLESYTAAFSSPCHVEINYAYLKAAGLLYPEERAQLITPSTNRFSVFRDTLEDYFPGILDPENDREGSAEFRKVA